MKSRLPHVTESNSILSYICRYTSEFCQSVTKVFLFYNFWVRKIIKKQACVSLGNSTGIFSSRTGSKAQLGFTKAVLSQNIDASIDNNLCL